MILPNEPFAKPLRALWRPRAMAEPPQLTTNAAPTKIQPRHGLLINPFYPKDAHASFGKHVLTPTLALTSFAATTPAHWSLQYWDENLLHGAPPADPLPELVGITVHLTFAKRAFAIADHFRRLGSKVVLGGLHVTSCPHECAPHADSLAFGDGVQIWPRILADCESGQLQKFYSAQFENAYREDPEPRRNILPHRSFLTNASLIATRGCHNRCSFCYLATDGLRMPYRMKDPAQIVAEFEATGEPYAVFIDNNLGSRRDYLHALCQALKPIKKVWSAAVAIDVTDDPSLVREMALAGCMGVFIGFESLSDDNLSASHKKTPKTSDYARRVRILHDNGIQVNGSFVLGFDHDRKDVFAQTAQWVEENRLECATFHILTPYPATPLFRQMEAQGRLLHRDWSRYDTGHAVFQPKHMSPQELEQGYGWMYQRLFSHTSIWHRRPNDWRAVPPYLLMSYLYKRSNRFWHFLIRNSLVHAVWSPIIAATRWRHVRFRQTLEQTPTTGQRAPSVLSAGV